MALSLFAIGALIALFLMSMKALFSKKQHPVDQIPGPSTLPLLGNIHKLLGPKNHTLKMQLKFSRDYFPIFRMWLGMTPVVTPLHPEDLKILLTSTEHITKSHDYEFIGEWWGDGLITSTGAKWHKHRRLLTPAFHFEILEKFLEVFHDKTEIFVTKLAEYVGKKEGVDMVPLFTRCALDIICATIMGINIDAQEGEESPYEKDVGEACSLIYRRSFRPWYWNRRIYHLTSEGRRFKKVVKRLQDFTKYIINERRSMRTSNGKVEINEKQRKDPDIYVYGSHRKNVAFLDLLLDTNEKDPSFTNEHIREEVDTFMPAGHDTTAMAMSWMLHFLGSHPEVQDRCAEELSEIFADSDRFPSSEDLSKMKYLTMVMKESMRLRPSVYLVVRKLETPLKLTNYEIPAGTIIHILIKGIHGNAEIFPEPQKFDPERFSPENSQHRHSFAYVPFSAGPRNCIGQKFAMMEMKTVLSSLLRNFKFESINPERDSEYMPDLTLRPINGVTLRVSRRGQ